MPPVAARAPPAPPPPTRFVKQVEAKWDYQTDDPADLNFKAGDVIELIEETSEDWWTGRLNGKEGMFPSNRCIKVESTPTA
ncbi:SH3-domain-containing protein [Ceratobasidium sp. AG-I]|nr:SH3-domain-containing protein [Ceratobasidium sp. AG-I]